MIVFSKPLLSYIKSQINLNEYKKISEEIKVDLLKNEKLNNFLGIIHLVFMQNYLTFNPSPLISKQLQAFTPPPPPPRPLPPHYPNYAYILMDTYILMH